MSVGSWKSTRGGQWSLPFRASLSEPATASISEETEWYLVFEAANSSFTIFPSKSGGIISTFQHQSFNDRGPADILWRAGNPCLHRPTAAFGRVSWNGQPDAIDEKIVWYVERLLLWIDAAAANELVVPGEPFELPSGPGQASFPVIGFVGTEDDLSFWPAQARKWGWADLAKIPRAVETYAVQVFRDSNLEEIFPVTWGSFVSSAKPSATALWIALDRLPVLAPWQLPRTWAALSKCLAEAGVDLPGILACAGADRRRGDKNNSVLTLLLGFPLSGTLGERPSRFHWIALSGLELSGRGTQKNGFRPVESAWQLIDHSWAKSGTTLNWLRSANWEPRELRTRSGSGQTIPSASVLLIGAGSLGSVLAENLVRMGITDMGILDPDRLDVGNLTRHALGVDAVGHNKANALASALNMIMPDATVIGLPSSFPPSENSIADQIRSFDVVVDCTGADSVLDLMAEFDWGGEKAFISLAMTWRAEGLLVYTASETAFPAIDAKERFLEFDIPPTDLDDARMEGIGCWHPVFPATAADVRLWSAIGSKAVLKAIESPGRRCDYFRQSADGTVEKVNS
nr:MULTISPECIES: ThiF family adenylyltransferase [unclassified Rhizobium]